MTELPHCCRCNCSLDSGAAEQLVAALADFLMHLALLTVDLSKCPTEHHHLYYEHDASSHVLECWLYADLHEGKNDI
jgi:hypothetical protein